MRNIRLIIDMGKLCNDYQTLLTPRSWAVFGFWGGILLVGTINRVIATLLFGKAGVRLGQEIIATNSSQDSPQATVVGISALLAFRHMTLVWGVRQWKNLVQGFSRLAVVALLLASLAALALIPSGTANLITPVEFNKTADLRGTELDFTSADPECIAFLGRSQLTNLCDWKVRSW